MTLGEGIRMHRERLGMTQAALAKAADLVPHDIWRFEADRNVPEIQTARRIATALGVTLDELVPSEPVPKD